MFKVDITKEANKKIAPEEQLLSEAQTLLLEAGDKDRKFLEAAGLDHQIREAEKDKGRALKGKEIRMKYGVPILSEIDVKELCIKYQLKCLPSKHYNGTVPPELGSVIGRFIEKLGDPNPEHAAQTNLYIMGPKEVFALQSYKVKTMPKDPVLFYRFKTDEGFYYAIISKWGNDFTVLRAIKGWIFAKQERYALLHFLTAFTIFTFIFSQFVFPETNTGMILSLFIGLSLSAIFRGCIGNYWNDSWERTKSRDQIFSEKGWNIETEHEHSKFLI